MREPEKLEANELILMVCKRNVGERRYGPKVEFKFRYGEKEVPKIEGLVKACKESLGLPKEQEVSIAKYIPHAFEWKWMNPEEVIVEKRGKKAKTEVKFRAAEIDLRKMPFLLKDGDIIGVRADNEPGAKEDDF